jgi:pilus assembly protein CpaF
VFAERSGRLEETGVRFLHAEHLFEFVIQLASATGREISLASPVTDGRLGTARLTLTLPPFSRHPSVTIRKHEGFTPSIRHYDETGFWDPASRAEISEALAQRRNILVSGAASSGKTTLLRHLVSRLPEDERLVTLEDTYELDAQAVHPHTVSLETRPPNKEGRFAIDLAAAVRHVLHMRPDRLLVGEIRGPEALPLLLALTSGHRGLLATIHAGSARQARERLALFAHLAAPSVPLAHLQSLVDETIDLVVHLDRNRLGERAVAQLWRR